MTHRPDFPLIHGALIARGIPCHLTSDEYGPAGITIGYAGRTIECSSDDGAYQLTFPCGMVRATMRTTAPAASVADEMAWQYDWWADVEVDGGEAAADCYAAEDAYDVARRAFNEIAAYVVGE